MKKILFLAVMAFLPIFIFQSCSNSDKDEPETNNEPNVTGVWENNNYFISLGSDGFYSAYIADEFVDSGNYTQTKDVILCKNTYFNRTTTYTIKRISDTELKVDITYTDLQGNNQNKNMTFFKSTTPPASQSNTLGGRSYRWLSSAFGYITMTFNAYNSGIKSATKGSAANYPLGFFYTYIGDKLYYQILRNENIQVPSIGSWTTNYNEVKCWKLSFSPNGSISGIDVIE